MKTPGQIAFDGFWNAVFSLYPIPNWDELSDEARLAWESSARAVINYVKRN